MPCCASFANAISHLILMNVSRTLVSSSMSREGNAVSCLFLLYMRAPSICGASSWKSVDGVLASNLLK